MAAQGIAVEQATGDVYVGDNHNRVEKFSASGQFLLMFGKNVDTTAGTSHPNLCTAADVAAGDTCGKGSSSTEAGAFSQAFYFPLTVGSAGEVWVGDESRLEEFTPEGVYVTQAAITGGGTTIALALSSDGDFYVKSASLAGVRRYEPSGTPVSSLTLLETLDATGKPEALALDPASGDLLVGDSTSPYRFMEFDPAGSQVSQFGAGQVIGKPSDDALAIDGVAGALYAASSTAGKGEQAVQRFSLPAPGPLIEDQHAAALGPKSVTLAAGLDPEGHTTTYSFEYGESQSYGQSTTVTMLPGAAFSEETVTASLNGLAPETTYHYRLVAEDSEGHISDGPDSTFTTSPAVQIEDQSATSVTGDSTTLQAELNPLGASATWWVEYGLTESYGASTTEQSLPSGSSLVPLSVFVPGLTPASVYHYRFAARDQREGVTYVVHGEDHTIATQLAGLASQLPDGRAWELVSPANKAGGQIDTLSSWQAAADGDGIAYQTTGSIEVGPQGGRLPEESEALSRHGADGWRSQDITSPNGAASPVLVGLGEEYREFSADLSEAVVAPRSVTPLSAEASERTPYLRDNLVEPASYRPLVTGKEGYANVPAGTEFGGYPLTASRSDVLYEGASPDLGHIVVSSSVPLASGASTRGVYEWESGRLQAVSVLPAGEGGAIVAGSLGAGGGGFANSVRFSVSANGRYVFWSRENDGMLYLRDTVSEESLRLDVVQSGATGVGKAEPVFQGASADGGRVFFTDTQQLTEDASESGADLYECEIVHQNGELGVLKGPAYFVSRGAQWPELVIVLQGEGVTVELNGETFISKQGITSTTFKTVPDVPFDTFQLTLPTGPHSALAANGNLCKTTLSMPTRITGQNGALIKQGTKLKVSGCAATRKKKHEKKKHGHKGKAARRRAAGKHKRKSSSVSRSARRGV